MKNNNIYNKNISILNLNAKLTILKGLYYVRPVTNLKKLSN